jgi:hypothetical protein
MYTHTSLVCVYTGWNEIRGQASYSDYLFKKQVQSYIQLMSCDASFSRYTLASNGVTRRNSVTCHDEKRVVRCTQDTRQGSVVSGWSWNTRDGHRDMPLTLCACNSWYWCTLRYPGRRHPNADVFRRLEQRDASGTRECSCGTRAVEKLARYRMRIGTVPAEGCQWHP